MTPFRVLLGIHPRVGNDTDIRELLQSELIAELDDGRAELREEAKGNIVKVQNENKATYNKKRKNSTVIEKEIWLLLNGRSKVLGSSSRINISDHMR